MKIENGFEMENRRCNGESRQWTDTSAIAHDAIPGILLVDDDPLIRNVLRRFLELNGYRVLGEASSGEEAVAMARRLDPDVILMDFMMEGMDGIAAVKEIISNRPDVKIIIVTGRILPHLVGDTFRAGAVNFILKPFDERSVVCAVRKAVGPYSQVFSGQSRCRGR